MIGYKDVNFLSVYTIVKYLAWWNYTTTRCDVLCSLSSCC